MESKPHGSWRSRIVAFEPHVDARVLVANPRNAKHHGDDQRQVLRAVIREVGQVGAVLVNRRNGLIVDGHMRVEEAAAAGATVPVLYTDLDDEEEAAVLATFDPISFLAEIEQSLWADLLNGFSIEDEALRRMLTDLAEDTGGYQPTLNPSDTGWQPSDYDEGKKKLEDGLTDTKPRTPVICPSCYHEFSV